MHPFAPPLHYRSAYRSMRLGLLGWIILITGAVGLLYLVNRFLRFEDDFSSWNIWAYFIIALHLCYPWALACTQPSVPTCHGSGKQN